MNLKKIVRSTAKIGLTLTATLLMASCGPSVKVINAWKNQQESVDKFKEKKILVIARTANTSARIAFESEIAEQMRSMGMNAIESFSKAPKIYPQKEITEERVEFIRSLMKSEGFNAVVITVVKDKTQSTVTDYDGFYVGGAYGAYYPGYYGSFYGYYATPYAYGPYYSSFGGTVPISGGATTRVVTDYVLETLMYNLDEPEEQQLVAVVTSKLDDPQDAYKTAEKYVEKITESLTKK